MLGRPLLALLLAVALSLAGCGDCTHSGKCRFPDFCGPYIVGGEV